MSISCADAGNQFSGVLYLDFLVIHATDMKVCFLVLFPGLLW